MERRFRDIRSILLPSLLVLASDPMTSFRGPSGRTHNSKADPDKKAKRKSRREARRRNRK